ncbi:MAG: hypothetical protein M3Z06_10150 [Actinomycetota bacterium]|nr:hypothetical protein [Actinomycetota bacterium]
MLAIAGCGGGAKFANQPRPATPVDLTVYINSQRVSVSPASVGAGPVIFIVTNQASKTESLTVRRAGNSGSALATTGPINPQETAQVTIDFSTGDYTVSTGKSGSSDATLAGASSIQPATLHIGRPRPSASNALLQP